MGLFSCFQPRSDAKYLQEGALTQDKVKGKAGGEVSPKAAPSHPKVQELEVEAKQPNAAQAEESGPDVVNPDASLIQHMLDPEGVAAVEKGKAYQVHYLGPPRPYCEEERVKTVHELGKIDEKNGKPQDPEIANILKLVSSIFQAPAVLCALFDEKQVYVSEQHGEVVPCGHFPWRWTLCGWSLAFKSPQVLVIPDTHKDARFANNMKVVDGPRVRFYCGAPLVSRNGHRLGTLCFADVKPRAFDRSSCVMMNSFSELVVRQLEKDVLLKAKAEENRMLFAASSQLQRTIDCLDNCVVLLDASKPGLEVVFTNVAFSKVTGLLREDVQGKMLVDLLERVDGTPLPSPDDVQHIAKLRDFMVHETRLKGAHSPKGFTLSFRPAARQIMDDETVPFGVPSYLPLDGPENSAQHFYFMTIERHGSRTNRRSSTIASSVLSALSSASATTSSTASSMIDGLKLAHLLGRGSFGVVYAGQWYGTDVAVKVIDHDLVSLLGADGAVKEAAMAFKLRHPHIVATLKYVVKSVGSSRGSSSMFDSSSSAYPKACAGKQATDSFSPRYLDGKSNEDISQAASGADGRWAVIKAEASIPEEVEADRQHQAVSEDSLAMRDLCKVKEDGWKELEEAETSHPVSGKAGACNSSSTAGGEHTEQQLPKQTWIIIEYCDRGSLQDAIDRGWMRQNVALLNSPPKLDEVIATAQEIASALQFMHSQDIVHGDLSAWNVMLTSMLKGDDSRGWVAKVCDFGFTRALEAVAITTKTYGTITHMPPETLTQGVVSKAMDVYSFGVLMWQMYTGSRPFSGLRQAVIIDNVCNKRLRLQWPQSTPPAFCAIADACMAYERDERPTFADLVEQLQGYSASSPEWQLPGELYF